MNSGKKEYLLYDTRIYTLLGIFIQWTWTYRTVGQVTVVNTSVGTVIGFVYVKAGANECKGETSKKEG